MFGARISRDRRVTTAVAPVSAISFFVWWNHDSGKLATVFVIRLARPSVIV